MRTMDEQKVANPPFQKIEDAVRSTGLSAYYLRRGCRDGSVPCVRSGRTYFINMLSIYSTIPNYSTITNYSTNYVNSK